MKKDDKAHLEDMLACCDHILEHGKGVGSDKLFKDDLLRAALERWLTIIGEATCRLSLEFKEGHPEIPWQAIKGMRNYIMHVYDGINYETISETVNSDIPPLHKFLKEYIETD